MSTFNKPPSKSSNLNDTELRLLRAQLSNWQLKNQPGHQYIQRTFNFSSYVAALKFIADLGELAEEHGHYPAIVTTYRKATVLWATEQDAMHNNGFSLAIKTDALIGSVNTS